jgi:hypothetical protein
MLTKEAKMQKTMQENSNLGSRTTRIPTQKLMQIANPKMPRKLKPRKQT